MHMIQRVIFQHRMTQLDILLNVESRTLSLKTRDESRFSSLNYLFYRNYPTKDNIDKKMKSDEERQERGDVLQTRQFGLV
jgi:hypothetical protein